MKPHVKQDVTNAGPVVDPRVSDPIVMSKVCPVCGASYTDNNVFCPSDGSSLRAAEAEGDLIGTVIADRYLITDLLGEGGMGKVFLARHVRLPQQAAIKVLRPAMLRDPDAVARFNREAANASRIEHERIARVFDYGESSDGTVYLAMEYVPGRTLKALLVAEGPQPPERAARITRQVADALDAAHRLDIVHRDLKPDNVMVIEDELLGDRCKVVDFGIAKALGSEGADGGLTKTGFVVGTPEFMSPEQLLGSAVDHRSDVYALALLSYQCFTGVLPFDSSTPERTMTARLMEQPRALATAMPDVAWPNTLERVFARGLARNVEERFASAGAFARELQSAVEQWQLAHAVSSAATVATPAAAARVVGASAPTPPRAPAPPAPVPHAAPPASTGTAANRTPLVVGGALGLVAIAVVAFVLRPTGTTAPAASSGNPSTASVTAVAAQPEEPVAPPSSGTVSDEQNERDALEAANTPSGTAGSGGSGSTSRNTGGATPGVNPTPESTLQRQQSITQQTQTANPVGGAGGDATSSSVSGGDAARRVLDSLRTALDPLTATEATARRGVAALRSLMPRLVTAEDSAWAYLREAEAHFLMTDERSACLALRAATPLVRTNGQRGVLNTMTGALSVSCGD